MIETVGKILEINRKVGYLEVVWGIKASGKYWWVSDMVPTYKLTPKLLMYDEFHNGFGSTMEMDSLIGIEARLWVKRESEGIEIIKIMNRTKERLLQKNQKRK